MGAQRDDPSATDRTVLEAIFAELREVHRKVDLLLESRPPEEAPGLADALREHFGPTAFTVRGLLTLCDEDPHCPLADEVAALIDWEATPHARAVALGMVLARMPELAVARRSRGMRMYRVRTSQD